MLLLRTFLQIGMRQRLLQVSRCGEIYVIPSLAPRHDNFEGVAPCHTGGSELKTTALMTHGSSGYVQGCRCADCRDGHRRRANAYTLKRASACTDCGSTSARASATGKRRCVPCAEKRLQASRLKAMAKKSKDRASDIAKSILVDSRKTDKKRQFANDLDLDFVREAIRGGCQYCGEMTIRMTLDRIDNSVGHVKSNVIPACIRCNYVRGAMPYDAWLILAPGMTRARELGLFGSWTARVR